MKKLAVLIGSGFLALSVIGLMALLVFVAERIIRAAGLAGH